MPRPLVTVTLNPALDLSASVPRVVPGPKLRTGPVTAEAGGGGLNVARVAASLGVPVTAIACLGGATGQRLERLLADLPGLTLHPLPLARETRESLSITCAATGGQFRFVLPGPAFDPADAAGLTARIAPAVPPGALVVLSGSQPPGLPDDLPLDLAAVLPAGAALLIDTSGPALDRLLAAPQANHAPLLLRLDEAEVAARAPGSDPAALARDLRARGVATCIAIACGARGNLLATPWGSWSCTPPQVPVVSKVGAGDSFMGGLVAALALGADWPEALRRGTAAAAACVATPGTQLAPPAEVTRLAPHCTLAPA
jgi:6-phosphofructokinase 2